MKIIERNLTFRSTKSIDIPNCIYFDYVGNPEEPKWTSSYVFDYLKGAISWISKLQKCKTLLCLKRNILLHLKLERICLTTLTSGGLLDLKHEEPQLLRPLDPTL